MTTAKRRAINHLRQQALHQREHEALGHDLEALQAQYAPDVVDTLMHAEQDDIGDDLLRLIFTACHPALPTEARVALTLRLLGGLTTAEIARAFLVPGAHRGPAHRARQAQPHGRAGAVCARRGRACAAPDHGAGGGLPHLQRRLCRHGRRRLDAPRAVR